MKDALGGGERMTSKKETHRGLFQWSWAESWCAVGLADNPARRARVRRPEAKKEAIKASLWSWRESWCAVGLADNPAHRARVRRPEAKKRGH